jgi:hypothetical protein
MAKVMNLLICSRFLFSIGCFLPHNISYQYLRKLGSTITNVTIISITRSSMCIITDFLTRMKRS